MLQIGNGYESALTGPADAPPNPDGVAARTDLSLVLSLDQATGDERRVRSAGNPGQLAQPADRDDRVLVLAEDVLELPCGVDEQSGALALCGRSQLGGVAGPLSLDAQLVERRVVQIRKASGPPAQLPELLPERACEA